MTSNDKTRPKINVFYAWQSDLDAKSNRYLIQDAAEKALKRIEKDPNVGFSVALDHDTKDIPGIPAVTDTILTKISNCDIFLADLTYVCHTAPRELEGPSKAIPNPNVLFELGYAFRVLGPEKIVLCMNEAYGKADLQIFDLAHRRWPITYSLPAGDVTQRNEKREALSRDIEKAIRDIIGKTTMRAVADREQQLQVRLQKWATESKDRWQQLVRERLADEHPARYPLGAWTVAYLIDGSFDKPDLASLRQLLGKAEHRGTRWPVWLIAQQGTPFYAYHFQDLLECWLKDIREPDAALFDFWRASPGGLMFLLRGYREDCTPVKVDPGKALWTHTAIQLVGECVLHARRLAAELGAGEGTLMFSFQWAGLSGRVLRDIEDMKGKKSWFDLTDRVCRQESVRSPVVRVPVQAIDEDLARVISDITKGLFLAFQFPEPPIDSIQTELAQLKKEIP